MIFFSLAFGTVFEFPEKIARVLKKIVSYWLAGSFILFFSTLFFLFINIFVAAPRYWVLSASFILTSILVAYAYHHAYKLFVKTIIFESSKISKGYTFVQLSDIHVGSNGKHEVEKIVHALESLVYDFVVITGDLIDEDFAHFSDLQPLHNIDKPIYYITGNHEYYLKRKSFKDFIKKTDIHDINNKKISFKEIDIYGVDEKSDVHEVLNRLEVDPQRYSLGLVHEPDYSQMKYAQKQGMDLMLSGHTHNGQIFPFTWLVRFRYRFLSGLYSINDMMIYVSSGTGTWGPKMRLGTSNEITLITIRPKK